MKRFFRMLLLVTLPVTLFASAVMAQNAQERNGASKPAPMDLERAKALFEDRRVQRFMTVVDRELGGKCSVPEPARTEAGTRHPGQAEGIRTDFASTFYEVTISCSGTDGLAGVRINAEFVPIMPAPLNLTLSVLYRE